MDRKKNVWQLRIAHGDIKRVLSHEYVSLVSSSEKVPAMEGRIIRGMEISSQSSRSEGWEKMCGATCGAGPVC